MMGNQGKKSYGLKTIYELSRHFVFRIFSIFTRRISSGSSANWASLPDDVLDLILHKVIGLSDYVRFGAVCKSWHSSSLIHKQLHCTIHRNQIPFLLVPPCQQKSRWGLFSMINNKFCNFELFLPYPCERFCGSSYGWLATTSCQRLILINPFSSTSNGNDLTTIRLPLFPFSNMKDFHVEKVILSCDPSLHPHDYIVVASYTFHKPRMLAYIKPSRDKSWTLIETRSLHTFSDLIYYKNHIYGLTFSSYLKSFNIEDDNRPTRMLVMKHTRTEMMLTKDYLVEASDGGLLLVQQRLLVPGHQQRSKSFFIFRLTAMPTDFEWVEIDGLGGDALFLGENTGVCVVASNYPGCHPNCIYYTTKCDNQDMDCFVSDDAGVYSCHDKSFRLFYRRTPEMKGSCIWILPKLQ